MSNKGFHSECVHRLCNASLQLISGVHHCHCSGVCHRDLKLENTLLDGNPAPRLKICDFGYSKVCVECGGVRSLMLLMCDYFLLSLFRLAFSHLAFKPSWPCPPRQFFRTPTFFSPPSTPSQSPPSAPLRTLPRRSSSGKSTTGRRPTSGLAGEWRIYI